MLKCYANIHGVMRALEQERPMADEPDDETRERPNRVPSVGSLEFVESPSAGVVALFLGELAATIRPRATLVFQGNYVLTIFAIYVAWGALVSLVLWMVLQL
jgi:hypothetical protein